jgi:hypothetical protein
MPTLVYFLCAITSGSCGALLYRQYASHRSKLLFWVMIGFMGLFLSNVLLVLDMVFFPDVDLSMLRSVVTLVSLLCMVFGFIWEAQ